MNNGSKGVWAIREWFVEAMTQTLQNLGRDDAIKIKAELLRGIGGWNAPYLLSPDHVAQLSIEIFGNELLRDWIFNTRFVFFMNAAMYAEQSVVEFVVEHLAQSASVDMNAMAFLSEAEQGVAAGASKIPQQFFDDLSDYEEARAVLVANNWLIVILLLIAFVPLDHPVLQLEKAEK